VADQQVQQTDLHVAQLGYRAEHLARDEVEAAG